MMRKFRVRPNASLEERAIGLVWDLQIGTVTYNGDVMWRSFIAFRTREEALSAMHTQKTH